MWFDDIDRMFESQRREFETLFKQLKDSPYSYGYTLRIGEDGKPVLKTFGNKPELTSRPELTNKTRSTHIDEIVDEDEVKFVLEMVGLEKEDISVEVIEDTLNISGQRGERKYDEKITLKYKVTGKPKATYKNGILEVKFKKDKPKSHKVGVE